MHYRCGGSRYALARAIGVVIVALGLGSTSANAISRMSVTPITQSVVVGSEFAIDIGMDFDEITIGGGFEISFDPLELSFLTFRFDQNFTANFGLLTPADGENVLPLEIAFGWLDFSGGGGPTVPTTVGQLTFRAEAPGAMSIVIVSPSASNPGPYYSASDFSTPMVVEFGAATVNVTSLPDPESGLLLVVGLIGLARLGHSQLSGGRFKSPV